MKIRYEVKDKILVINGNEISFDNPIRAVRLLGQRLFVLLSIPFDEHECRNLYAVEAVGKVAWQVQDLREIAEISDPLPFEHLQITEAGEILVSDFNGRRLRVDPKTGKFLGRDFIK